MATMDHTPDSPAEGAEQTDRPTGGATAYGSLFSHDEEGQPTATTAKKTAAKRAPAKKAPAKSAVAKTTAAKRAGRSAGKASAGEAATDGESQDAAQGTAEATAGANVSVDEDAMDLDPAADSDELAEGETDEAPAAPVASASPFGLLFQAPDLTAAPARAPRRRAPEPEPVEAAESDDAADAETSGQDESTARPARGGRNRRSTSRGGASRSDTTQESSEEAAQSPQTDEDSTGPDSDDLDEDGAANRRRRRRGGKGRRGRGGNGEELGESDNQEDQSERGGATSEADTDDSGSGDGEGEGEGEGEASSGNVRRRRRSNRRGEDGEARESRRAREEVTGVRGSTRLEAKRQRRREGREAGRRRTIITEAEFLARRESVERTMVVRGLEDRTQIGVLEDGVLVEHYVSRETQATSVGNVYLGRVQNVLPSMEAAFVDIGKGRNAVLYAGEVNWDAAGLDNNQPKRIENALKSGDSVLVQVTKDPIGHKGARLTSQVSLPGRYLVLVPGNSMTGISRKLPDTERARLKKILKEVVPEGAGVIVRTAAEGASEEELRADVERLTGMWQRIEGKQKSANAPALVHGEPDMTVRVIRDVFNEDFAKVVVAGEQAWNEVSDYISNVAPDLAERLEKWTGTQDVFTHYRVTEALSKAMDRKVWLPSGGSLVIDRTEAMTVVDVNTGKFVGSGGNLEETVTKNNIEAAEEIVRQLRLRDIGGIIVIDFIDMVLESNRDLVVRRLLECLGRDRTKHQVAEVTSLGLVQMTRKRVGAGLIEVFSESCVHCNGRGIVVHAEPIDRSEGNGNGHSHSNQGSSGSGSSSGSGGGRRGRGRSGGQSGSQGNESALSRPAPAPGGPTAAQIAAAAHAAAIAGTGQAAPAAEVDTQAQAPVETPATESASETSGTEPSSTGSTSDDSSSGGTASPSASASSESPTGDAQTVSATAPTEVPTQAPPMESAVQTATRPRRRRGRVVAAAGPPGGVPTEAVESASASAVSDDH